MADLRTNVPYGDSMSYLFAFQPVDAVDDWEKSAQSYWIQMKPRVMGRTEAEVVPALQQMVLEAGNSDAVTVGLLYAVLTEDALNPQAALGWIGLVVRDEYRSIVLFLRYMLSSLRFNRLHLRVKNMNLHILGTLIGRNVAGLGDLVILAIRQVTAGDLSEDNVRYAAQVVDFLGHQFVAVETSQLHAAVVPTAFYAVCGMMRDHYALPDVLRTEIALFQSFILRQFAHVRRLGRELPRIITDLSNLNIPEALEIARRLTQEPSTFAQSFLGVPDLMKTPTAREVYLARISPEMEAKIRFLLTRASVRNAEPRKYNIEWLKRRFFPGPDRSSAIIDIVRYVVAKFHPSNEIIQSDVVQRWQLITYILLWTDDEILLGGIRNSLLWDWLAYDRTTDNVMHIEAAILTMFWNKSQYTDRLVGRVMNHLAVMISLWPDLVANVRNALKDVARSRMLKYEELVSLKEGLAETDAKRWLEWLPTEQALATDDDMKSDNYSGSAMDVDGPLNMGYGSKASDDEVPVPEDPTKLFEDALKNLAEAIKSGDGPGSQHLLSTILDNDTLATSDAAVQSLIAVLQRSLSTEIDDFLTKMDTKAAAESSSSVIPSLLSSLLEGDSLLHKICSKRLIAHYRDQHPRFGATILVYVVMMDSANADAWTLYQGTFLPCAGAGKIVSELGELHDRNLRLFYHTLPILLSHAKDDVATAIRTPQLIYRLVSLIDPRTLHFMSTKLAMGEFRLFDQPSVITIAKKSLAWESFEQSSFWELLRSDVVNSQKLFDWAFDLLDDVDWNVNVEASEGMLSVLQDSTPTKQLVGKIVLLRQWSRSFPRALTESMAAFLLDEAKNIEMERNGGFASSPRRTGPDHVARVDSALSNLVIWRSIFSRVGGDDPILGDIAVREALQPLLADEAFFNRHQKLLLALKA